jgi:hypothetical protein
VCESCAKFGVSKLARWLTADKPEAYSSKQVGFCVWTDLGMVLLLSQPELRSRSPFAVALAEVLPRGFSLREVLLTAITSLVMDTEREIRIRYEAKFAAIAALDRSYYLNPAPSRAERLNYATRQDHMAELRSRLYAELRIARELLRSGGPEYLGRAN